MFYPLFGQQKERQFTLDADYYYGSILPHSNKIIHLITGHPEGVFISFQQKTFGAEEWESRLNYPDFGLTFHYQNNKNPELGDLYGLLGHYNFYFLKRHLQFKVGQGVAYNTNPYDKEDNYRNVAFGSHLMPVTLFMLNFQKENLWEGLGLRAGVFLIHHSNGLFKSPNTGTNTVGANLGLHYVFDHKNEIEYQAAEYDELFYEPIRFNFVFRGGVHESYITGSGQYPFYVFSVYADKKLTRSGAVQLGTELFLSMMRKHEIEMLAVSFPEFNVASGTDYKRLGIFAGYELFINRLSAEGQLGFYVYDKAELDSRLYQRLGLKYYFYKNIFAGVGLKTHLSKAESTEFTLGIRL